MNDITVIRFVGEVNIMSQINTCLIWISMVENNKVKSF